MDHSAFVRRQLEFLWYGEVREKIPVRVYTDSEPTLESIASTKQIETKMLRQYVEELKETLTTRQIESYGWLPSQDMVADGLTKEMRIAEYLSDLFCVCLIKYVRLIFLVHSTTTLPLKLPFSH